MRGKTEKDMWGFQAVISTVEIFSRYEKMSWLGRRLLMGKPLNVSRWVVVTKGQIHGHV